VELIGEAMRPDHADAVDRDGFAVVPGVLPPARVEAVLAELMPRLEVPEEATFVRSQRGNVYAARNVVSLYPQAAELWRVAPLPELLHELLGPRFGLVRVLFFDKPPEQTWSLPWHKDLTVAVRDNRLPSTCFARPTRKAGVPHVEAPREVLEAMLTVRVHLDDVTAENGPLQVLPGSHTTGKVLRLVGSPHSILVNRGDVLLMRPLLTHGSNASRPGTRRHRRILHLEFAAQPELPDGYAWHAFIPGLAA
jgi:phytanoyl-CoA dioxygenase PhyH